MCWFWWSSGRQVLPCELRPDLMEHPRGPENNKSQCYTTCYKICLKNGNCEGTLTQPEEDLKILWLAWLIFTVSQYFNKKKYWISLKKRKKAQTLCIVLFDTIIIFVLLCSHFCIIPTFVMLDWKSKGMRSMGSEHSMYYIKVFCHNL